MVASQAAMQQNAAAGVAEFAAAIEAHATSGEWELVEELVARLRAAVMDVPEGQRRESLLLAQQALERVQSQAKDARSDVAEKLSAIRRGKDAARAYTAAE